MHSFIILVLLFLLSCGKKIEGSKGPSSKIPQLDLGGIESVRQTDLLDATVDLPFQISGNKIIFKRGDNQSISGLYTTCTMGVDFGEVWDYNQTGSDSLDITMKGKLYKFQRATPGQGLLGGWSWRSFEGETLILKRLTFLTMDRLIMRTHCEH